MPAPRPLERQQVGVEPPPADDVAARGRHVHAPAPRQQRPRQQDRGADRAAEVRVRIVVAETRGAHAHRVATGERNFGAELAQQTHLRLDIADPGHVSERDLFVREERGRKERQRRVLVAPRPQRARDRLTALDDELGARYVCGRVHRAVS